ncbi:hypothetical protein COCVIDRAFT_111971, partial [Bipolaris victoriae FI3]
RRLTTTIFFYAPLMALAKDMAVFYTWTPYESSNSYRDNHAISMCGDIGGHIASREIGIPDGVYPNECAICRSARDSTKDYDRDWFDNSVNSYVDYAVRTGYYGRNSCHA